MKQGLVLLLLVVAAAYEPGKEYIYKYETVTTSALHSMTNQVSALKVTVTTRLQIDGRQRVTLQFGSPRLCKLNQEVPSSETLETTLEQHCFALTGPETEVIAQQLVKPFTFRLQLGIPTELRADGTDPVWSVNLKRGFINMLQLNLQEHDIIIDPGDDVTQNNAPWQWTSDNLHRVFRSYESDMVGECETTYTVIEDGVINNELHVNKIRNYDDCKAKPAFYSGLLSVIKDTNQRMSQTPVKTMSHVDYLLIGNRRDYVIKDATMETLVTFSPYGNHNPEAAQTAFSQRLGLTEIIPWSSFIPLGRAMRTVPCLQMELPMDLTSEVPPTNVVEPEIARIWITQISQLLTQIASLTDATVREEVPEKVAWMVQLMKDLPLSVLNEVIATHLFNETGTDSYVTRKKEVLLDVLPTLTRPDLVEVIKELLARDVISPARASIMINMMAMTVKPSPKIFGDLMLLMREPAVSSSSGLRKSILLSAGILADKIQTMYTDMELDGPLAFSQVHRIAQDLIQMWRCATPLKERLEVMSVFANAGLLDLVPEMEVVITDAGTPTVLKVGAISALRKMAPKAPQKIQSLLLPIYLKPTVPKEVRMASFLVLMKTEPSSSLLQYLTYGLKQETSIDVLSFVYTYLEALSLTDDPLLYNISVKAKLALNEVRRVQPGLMHSKFIKLEKFVASLGPLGTDIKLALFNSGHSPIPDNFFTKIASTIFGKKINVVELGVHTTGLKSILWNTMGPLNRLDDWLRGNGTLQDFLLPLTDLASKILHSTDNINNKFSTSHVPLSEKVLHVYMKLLENKVISVILDEPAIRDLITELTSVLPETLSRLQSGMHLDVLKTLSIVDASLMLPTPAGIPLSINATAVSMVGIVGDVRLEGMSSLFHLSSTYNPPVVNLTTDLMTSSATTLQCLMGAALPFFQSLAKVEVNLASKLPLKCETSVNILEQKFTFALEPINMDHTIFEVKSIPMTAIVKRFITPTPEPFEVEELQINTPPTVQATHGPYGASVGIAIIVHSEMPPVTHLLEPGSLFMGPLSAEIVWAAHRGVPRKYEFEIWHLGADRATPPTGSSAHSYRTSSRDLTSLEFDPIELEPHIVEDSRRELLMTWRTYGSMEMEVTVKLAHLHDQFWLKHQVDMQLISTPLVENAVEPIKVKVYGILRIPDLFVNYTTSVSYEEEEKFLKVKVKYGSSEDVHTLVTTKMYWRRLPMPNGLNSVHRSLNMPFYNLAMRVPSVYRNSSVLQGLLNATAHRRLYQGDVSSMPLVISTEMDYANDRMPSWLSWALPSLKHWLLGIPSVVASKAMVSVMPAVNHEERLLIYAIIDPVSEQVTLEMLSPSQTISILGLTLPTPVLFTEYRHTPAWPELITNVMHGDIPSGWCSVSPDHVVSSYDLLSVPLPEDTCEVVLVKDCSALNSFMVTTEKLQDVDKKLVRVYLPSKELEIRPVGSDVEVLVNGEIVPIHDARPAVIRAPISGKPVLTIIKKLDSILVRHHPFGLLVESDGASVAVKISEWYRGQTCGVCGDSNSDLYNELRGPERELYGSSAPFVHSYMIPSDDCTIPDHQHHSYSSEYRMSCEMLFRNLVLTRELEGVAHTCLSRERVPLCSRSCTAHGLIDAHVSFYCLPSWMPEAHRLLRLAQRQPLCLVQKPSSLEEVVSMPRRCDPVY